MITDFLNKILFKMMTIVDKSINEEKLVIVINGTISNRYSLTPDGQQQDQQGITLDVVDVKHSIQMGLIVRYSWTITDIKRFMSEYKLEDEKKFADEIAMINTLLMEEFNRLGEQLKSVAESLSVTRQLSCPSCLDKSISFVTQNSLLANIAYKTIRGMPKITDEHCEILGGIIQDEIISNCNIDTDNEKEVKKFIDDLEVKIIEAMPSGSVTADIKINPEVIIAEINKIKEMGSDDFE